MRKSPVSAVVQDVRRDWRAWSQAERFSAKLAGLGVVTLAILLHWPV